MNHLNPYRYANVVRRPRDPGSADVILLDADWDDTDVRTAIDENTQYAVADAIRARRAAAE